MDLTPMHKRVIALDVHQAKITACAVVEHDDGRVEVTKLDFGAFKRDRRALAQWALRDPARSGRHGEHGRVLEEPVRGAGGGGHHRVGGQRPARQGRARSQDRHGRRAVAGHAGPAGSAARVVHPAGADAPASPGGAPAAEAGGHVQRARRTGCTRCWSTPASASTCWSPTSTAQAPARWSRRSSRASPCTRCWTARAGCGASREELFEALEHRAVQRRAPLRGRARSCSTSSRSSSASRGWTSTC